MKKRRVLRRTKTPVATRLREALADADWSIYRLHQELARVGVKGSSYANVTAACEGESRPGGKKSWKHPQPFTPTVPFIQAAAKLLKVSPSWLAFGEGSKTPAAAIVAEVSAEVRAREAREAAMFEEIGRVGELVDRHHKAVQSAFERAFPPAQIYAQGDMEPVWEVAVRPWFSGRHRFAVRGDNQKMVDLAAARAVGRAFAAPLKALKVDPNRLSRWQLQQYPRILAAALEVLLLEPGDLTHFVYRVGKAPTGARARVRRHTGKAAPGAPTGARTG